MDQILHNIKDNVMHNNELYISLNVQKYLIENKSLLIKIKCMLVRKKLYNKIK